MVNKASQELTGVYIKRFENISFSFKANIRLEFTRLKPEGGDRHWQSKRAGSRGSLFGQVSVSDSFRD